MVSSEGAFRPLLTTEGVEPDGLVILMVEVPICVRYTHFIDHVDRARAARIAEHSSYVMFPSCVSDGPSVRVLNIGAVGSPLQEHPDVPAEPSINGNKKEGRHLALMVELYEVRHSY